MAKIRTRVRAVDMLSLILPKYRMEDEKNRLNPENGLCLSATYDAAFDRHFISFDEHYRLIVSKEIKDHYADAVAKSYFLDREQQMCILSVITTLRIVLAKYRKLLAA